MTRIIYDPDFIKEFKRLDPIIQKHAVKCETLFQQNQLHPSLRLHRLRGRLADLWSISVTHSVRIIFRKNQSGAIVFLSIGHHDIYRSM